MGLKIKEHNSSAAWQRTTDLVRIVNRLVKKEHFSIKEELQKDKHPEVTEIVWIEYDLLQKRSGSEWQSREVGQRGPNKMPLPTALEEFNRFLIGFEDKGLRVGLVTFGHWELGYQLPLEA